MPAVDRHFESFAYTEMQQMMNDVTGKPFPEFMQETVLTPLRMEASTYEQPLPKDKGLLRRWETSRRQVAHLPGKDGGWPVDNGVRSGALRHRHTAGAGRQVESSDLTVDDPSDAHRSKGWQRAGAGP